MGLQVECLEGSLVCPCWVMSNTLPPHLPCRKRFADLGIEWHQIIYEFNESVPIWKKITCEDINDSNTYWEWLKLNLNQRKI